MNSLTKGLVLVAVLLLVGAGLVFWKSKVGAHQEPVAEVSADEMSMIVKDLDPMAIRQIAQNPEAKKELADNVKQILALGAQAEKSGITADINVQRELENLDDELLAVNYYTEFIDKENKFPQFSKLSEEDVKNFYAGQGIEPSFWSKLHLGKTPAEQREAAFEQFLDTKIQLAKESGALPPGTKITDEQKKQARDFYAKSRIYAAEAHSKMGELGDEFKRKTELQIKLQKAQTLARLYAKKDLADKFKVTDADVEKYIEEHPELTSKAEKKAQAEQVLDRLKGGEDFAKLAEEFSEDPGSKSKGGLYEGITVGSFDPTFEKAALALEPGQFTQELVETPFGFHIIKLEKKGTAKDQTGNDAPSFDVRHILFSTMVKDPENPMAREVPLKDFVQAKLEKEKQEEVLKEIEENNPVKVAEDFKVDTAGLPEAPQFPGGMMPEDLPPGVDDGAPKDKNAPKKPETKKKK